MFHQSHACSPAACKDQGKTVSSNKDSLTCALRAETAVMMALSSRKLMCFLAWDSGSALDRAATPESHCPHPRLAQALVRWSLRVSCGVSQHLSRQCTTGQHETQPALGLLTLVRWVLRKGGGDTSWHMQDRSVEVKGGGNTRPHDMYVGLLFGCVLSSQTLSQLPSLKTVGNSQIL